MKVRNIFLSGIILSMLTPFAAAGNIPSFNRENLSEQDAAVTTVLNNLKEAQQQKENYDPQGLVKAVTVNNLPWVKEMLAKGLVNIETADEKGRTPLMISTRKDINIEIMHILLKANANVLTKDKDGRTALVHATRNGNTEAVDYLLRAHSDVNMQDNYEWTPVMYAVANRDLAMLKTLLEYKPTLDPVLPGNNCALFLAVEEGNRDILVELLRNGVNIFYRGRQNMTALMYAAALGKTEMMTFLIRADSRIDDTNEAEVGRTALMYAAGTNHKDCVRVLLDWNADRTIKDKNGYTAYDYAAQNGYDDIASIIKMP